MERFSNPAVADTIGRQCLQTRTTIPTFLLPVIGGSLQASRPITVGASVAVWACSAEESGDWQIIDRRCGELIACAPGSDVYAFVDNEELFGELAGNSASRRQYALAQGDPP